MNIGSLFFPSPRDHRLQAQFLQGCEALQGCSPEPRSLRAKAGVNPQPGKSQSGISAEQDGRLRILFQSEVAHRCHCPAGQREGPDAHLAGGAMAEVKVVVKEERRGAVET